jgi:ADP-heptose:LPS heptosyltransferase
MKTTKPTDVWFFVGHSIGVTLLAIHTLEAAYFGLPKNERGRCYVVINGDKTQLYLDLIDQYPHITLVTLSRSSIGKLVRVLVAGIGRRQIVLHPLSFGSVHPLHAVLTRIITCSHWHSRSVVLGTRTFYNRLWFTDVLPPKLDQSIFTSMVEAVAQCGITITACRPQLLHAVAPVNEALAAVPLPYIVVHPFAANPIRSLPPERWQELFDFITTTYPRYQLVISGGPSDRVEALAFFRPSYKNVFFTEDIISTFLPKIGLIDNAALYVGVDTGPTHLAAHLGVPTIVIGNNSNPCWLPTYNREVVVLMHTEHCSCTSDKCGNCREIVDGKVYYRCMIEITQEEIKDNITNKLPSHEQSHQTN